MLDHRRGKPVAAQRCPLGAAAAQAFRQITGAERVARGGGIHYALRRQRDRRYLKSLSPR